MNGGPDFALDLGYDDPEESGPRAAQTTGDLDDAYRGGIDVGHRSDTGPFALVPAWVLNAHPSSRALHLYAILALHADRSGRSFPSRKRLCGELGVSSVNTVLAAMKELETIQALTVSARFASYGQTTNGYIVHRIPPEGRQSSDRGGAADAGSPRAVGRAQNQTHSEPDSLTGESTENGASTLVAYYVETYRKLHGGMDPHRRWKASAGKAAKDALADYPAEDIRKALFVCANENKNPGGLIPIIADYHRDRAKGKA